MERKMIWCLRVFWFLVGFLFSQLITPSHAQDTGCRSLRMSQIDCMQFISAFQERQRQQEIAQREIDERVFLQQRADKLNRLYQEIADDWHKAIDAQQAQLNAQAQGLVDYRNDVLLDKLTLEIANKAKELHALNRIKR